MVFTDYCIYWVHRWEHHPICYKWLHKPHHKWLSTSYFCYMNLINRLADPLISNSVPSPFASHAFHPLDGYAQSLPYHIFPFIFPLHQKLFLVLFSFVNFWAILASIPLT